NRIARDMHDGLVQYVYALGLQLEHARDLAASEPGAVAAVLTGSIQQTNHVLSEMRTFIYQLRPIIMKEKEIGQWVLDLCRQFQEATGIPVQAGYPCVAVAGLRHPGGAARHRGQRAWLRCRHPASPGDGAGAWPDQHRGARPGPRRHARAGKRTRRRHPVGGGVSVQPMNTGTVRLLIADDHEMIRLGLRSMLESDPRIRVVGEAASPQDAVYQAALLRPDVVLLDVRMPGGSGIDACREILGRNLGSKVIMLTSYADEDAVYESIMAGASGYLLKEINKAGLIDALISVSEGRSLLDPEVTRKVLERIRKVAASTDEVARAALS